MRQPIATSRILAPRPFSSGVLSGIKVIEEGECLKSWIRSGLVAAVRRLRDIEAQEAAIEAGDDDEVVMAS
jgi:hypothetical protein